MHKGQYPLETEFLQTQQNKKTKITEMPGGPVASEATVVVPQTRPTPSEPQGRKVTEAWTFDAEMHCPPGYASKGGLWDNCIYEPLVKATVQTDFLFDVCCFSMAGAA